MDFSEVVNHHSSCCITVSMRKTDTSRLSVDGLRPGTAIFDLDKCVEIKRWAVKFCDFTVIRDGHPLLLAVFEFKKGWCDASDIIKQLSGGVRWLDAQVSDQPIRSLIPVLVFSKGISPNEPEGTEETED